MNQIHFLVNEFCEELITRLPQGYGWGLVSEDYTEDGHGWTIIEFDESFDQVVDDRIHKIPGIEYYWVNTE